MEGFRFTHPYRVGIADINFAGHVANAALLNYFQEVRIAYLEALGGFSELHLGDGCGAILVEARVRYRAEMFHGELLQLGARIETIGRTSFRIGYRIERDGKVTTEGDTVLAAFDYERRRTRRVPQGLRDAATLFEGRALEET